MLSHPSFARRQAAFVAGIVALLMTSALRVYGQELSDDERQAGFESMFNGKDFSGWRFTGSKDGDPPPENWTVADGVIKLSGGGKPNLAAVAEYADFEMRLEWRAGREK